MPFVSRAQQKLFYARARHSKKWKKMAAKWQAHTGKGKLPEHKK